MPGIALGFAVLVPLIFLPGFRDGFTLPKFAAAGLLLAAGAAATALRRGRGWSGSTVDAPLWAFAGAALLSALFTTDAWLSWNGPDKQYLWGLPGLAACAGAFYLGCSAAGGDRERSRLLRWAAAASIPVCLLACQQSLAANLGFGSGGTRPYSTFGYPTFLGAYFALMLPSSMEAARGRRIVGKAALAACAVGLALSGSRAAWLGGGAGAAAYLYWSRRAADKRPPSPRGLRAAYAGALLLTALLFAAVGLRRAATNAETTRRGDSVRLGAWAASVRIARERPWTGSGPGTFSLGFRRHRGKSVAAMGEGLYSLGQAHNDWFEVLASLGLLGLFAYLWLHAAALRRLSGAVRAGGGAAAAMAAGLLSLFVFAKFNSPSLGPVLLAALFAGHLLSAGDAPGGAASGRWRALVQGAALLSVLLAAGTALRLFAGDAADTFGRGARRGGRPRLAAVRFERAVSASPGVMRYRFDLANLLWDSAAAGGKEEAEPLYDRAVGLAVDGVRLRPLEAESHRLLGLALLRRCEALGGWGASQARKAFEASLLLDPYHLRTLEDLAALEGFAAGRKRPSGA